MSKAYVWNNAECTCAHAYLLPTLTHILDALALPSHEKKIFDLGCGNGSVAFRLAQMGWTVSGVDPSEDGIAQARKTFPDLNLRLGSAYDDLVGQYGTFPVLLSFEVVEHLYDPRLFARNAFDLTRPGGMVIISTPYHGYLKNLAIAVAGKWDAHFTALWDGGHIKFWSQNSLRLLLMEAGFENIEFYRVGRVPIFAKSMIAVAKRPR